ncbi:MULTISPECIES: hypothetical protein [Haloarcula]|uniref:hypothetical protein n=1 Tax=Haloarcula TaxID=2237 RepID=UPI0023ED308B|nr:hypothetical protein [Halomicroarcula sp. XH51]
MTDRTAKLSQLAADLRASDGVVDAFLAKSFTDRLLILDVSGGDPVPDAVSARLAENGLRAAEEVYGDDETARSFAGVVGDAARHHFVDVQTRGRHQSDTVE